MIQADSPTASDTRGKPDLRPFASALLLAVAGIAAYANSFQGAFVFDDREILTNSYIRQLWPPWVSALSPTYRTRPLIGLSLALNYAISGTGVWSYHLFNLLVHILAGLTLFGIVRHTLNTSLLRERFGRHSFAIALVVAVIWEVHPLNTQSVTYVIQRCESLMGLFYLVTIYCFIRSLDSPRKRLWQGATIATCAAGMLSKQVMATAPIVVFLYDVVFVAGSVQLAWQQRRRLYAGLAATWILTAATIAFAAPDPTAGFSATLLSPWAYFLSQFSVIVHYLRLALWPDVLIIDYDWPAARTAASILPFAIPLAVAGVASVVALARRKPAGFLGVSFFLILSVTSSFMPIADLAFEHRMYLPLTVVIVFLVTAAYLLGMRAAKLVPVDGSASAFRILALILVTIAVAGLGFRTVRRNEDYRSDLTMWMEVVSQRPENGRAHNNLGMLLAERGLTEEAADEFSLSCKYSPTVAEAQNNYGLALSTLGNYDQGIAHLAEALRLKPDYADAHCNLGRALIGKGSLDEAIAELHRAIELNPDYAEAYYYAGVAFEKQHNPSQAMVEFNAALRLKPQWIGALSHVSLLLATSSDPLVRNAGEAMRLAERAVDLSRGSHPAPLAALGAVYAAVGRFPEAAQAAQKAMDIASTSGNTALANQLEARLRAYKQGHDVGPSETPQD